MTKTVWQKPISSVCWLL